MRFHARTHDDDGDGRQRASGWISLFRFGGFPHIFLIECGWMDGRYWFFSVPHLSCYPESGSSATNPHMRGEGMSIGVRLTISGRSGESLGSTWVSVCVWIGECVSCDSVRQIIKSIQIKIALGEKDGSDVGTTTEDDVRIVYEMSWKRMLLS